jgi:uncharacterized protein YjbI with pentapeptide repeats
MHVEIFSSGVRSWNRWRQENPEIKPNLDGLRACDVLGKLEDDFFDCYLESINLSNASLVGSDFRDVNLRKCSFERADLTEARLRRAALSGANLRNALLIAADFTFVDVDGANFEGATFGDTFVVRMDLSRARGLEHSHHRFGSIVDLGTLEKTRKGLLDYPLRRPEILSFLKLCEVPPQYLQLFESLTSLPRQDA